VTGKLAFLSHLVLLFSLIGVNVLIARNPPMSDPIKGTDRGFILPRLNDITGRSPASPPSHALQRPIFSKLRQPFQPSQTAEDNVASNLPEPPPTAAATANPELTVLLSGLRRSEGSSQALLMLPGESDAHWISEGQEIGGWVLTAVGANAAELEFGGARQLVELYPAQTPSGSMP
jgi:hypothetical protein